MKKALHTWNRNTKKEAVANNPWMDLNALSVDRDLRPHHDLSILST